MQMDLAPAQILNYDGGGGGVGSEEQLLCLLKQELWLCGDGEILMELWLENAIGALWNPAAWECYADQVDNKVGGRELERD